MHANLSCLAVEAFLEKVGEALSQLHSNTYSSVGSDHDAALPLCLNQPNNQQEYKTAYNIWLGSEGQCAGIMVLLDPALHP